MSSRPQYVKYIIRNIFPILSFPYPRASLDGGGPLSFSRLLEIVLPRGGYILATIEAYFDESGSHDGSPVLCVAGYVMDSGRARLLDLDWQSVLRRFGLRYFRMSDCAHGRGHFKRLPREQRILIATKMISVVTEHASVGIGATINMEDYARFMVPLPQLGGAYSFCARHCLAATQIAIEEDFGIPGDVAYFFESGHKSQAEANGIMNQVFEDQELRREYRYASHAFMPKESSSALQAADLFAWQAFTYRKRYLSGNRVFRKDFEALCQGTPHKLTHITRPQLEEMSSTIIEGLIREGALQRG